MSIDKFPDLKLKSVQFQYSRTPYIIKSLSLIFLKYSREYREAEKFALEQKLKIRRYV